MDRETQEFFYDMHALGVPPHLRDPDAAGSATREEVAEVEVVCPDDENVK